MRRQVNRFAALATVLALGGLSISGMAVWSHAAEPTLRGAPEDEPPPAQTPPLPQGYETPTPAPPPWSVPAAPSVVAPSRVGQSGTALPAMTAPLPAAPAVAPARRPVAAPLIPSGRRIDGPTGRPVQALPPAPSQPSTVPDMAPARPAPPVLAPPPAMPATPAAAISRPGPDLTRTLRTPIVFASSAEGLDRLALSGEGGLCVAARNGLGPPLEVGGRPAVLASCGPTTAPVALVDGALLAGANRSHQLVPIAAPATGCRMIDILSGMRRNLIGVCTQPYDSASGFDETLSPPGWAHIVAQTPAPGVVYGPGALLMVAPIGPENPLAQAFVHDQQAGVIRVLGTDLCLATPPGDATAGAPIMLRRCTEAGSFGFRMGG